MKRVIILLLLILVLCFTIFAEAEEQPVVVIGSLRLGIDNGYLYPEIAIDENGKWREATEKDLWINQRFIAFPYSYRSKELNNIEVSISSVLNLPAEIKPDVKISERSRCLGVYSKNLKFNNIGIGRPILPKIVNEEAKKAFLKNTEIKTMLETVVKYDWDNIKNDFSVEFSSNIVDFMVGDLNGDKVDDYVLIIGARYSDAEGAAIIVYLKDKDEFKRVPVKCWKKATDYSGWPKLLFMRDFNNDGMQELFISDSDSDTDRFIVYSWSNEGLTKVFEGKREVWH